MRFKTIVEPTGVQKGDEWLSPDGYSSTWRRVWNGTAWVEDLKAAGFPATGLSPSNPDLSNVGTDEDEAEDGEDDQPQTDEDQSDEQGVQAEVSDSNGGEQGSGGEPEPESKQRGKRGKVQSRRKGK